MRLDARREHEHEHHDEVQRQVEDGGEHRGGRDDEPREADLAQQRLAVLHRGHGRCPSPLGVEGEQDHAAEQHDRVVLHLVAEVHELGEDDVDDPEQQQRAHQLPQVAQRRAEELQPEVGRRERPGQVREAARVVAERVRPGAARRRRRSCLDDGARTRPAAARSRSRAAGRRSRRGSAARWRRRIRTARAGRSTDRRHPRGRPPAWRRRVRTRTRSRAGR